VLFPCQTCIPFLTSNTWIPFRTSKSDFAVTLFKNSEPLYFMESEKYNDLPQRVQTLRSIGTKFSNITLDILELFAQNKSLTITEITRVIKSTEIERVYKNVRDIVQKLESSKLIIEDTEVDKTKRRHNEKYFRLTDDGIYQLFLNRVHGILVDQLSVKKGQTPVSYVDTFLKCYGNNLLFELFLYPYFEKETISVDNFGLLVKLFRYVHDCCVRLDVAITVGSVVPYVFPKFSWNKIPGQDETALLTSIKEIFSLEDLNQDNTRVDKTRDNSTIILSAPQIHITIKLDLPGSKAIAKLYTANKKSFSKYEYKIVNLLSEITACTTRPTEDSIKSALDIRELIEAPLYELVSSIGRRSVAQAETDYNNLVLAQDTKFMTLLEYVHSNFETGYHHLMQLRKKS
jgi:hypothetical protein